MIRILSIDGGGIRGIVPAYLLSFLEEELQTLSNNKQARLADYFDFVAGTSTGGIISCLLLAPPNHNNYRFTARDAFDLYVAHGQSIFVPKHSVLRALLSVFSHSLKIGFTDEIYNAEPLEQLLAKQFGDIELRQLSKPSLITAYNIDSRRPHFFTQHTAAQSNRKNFYVRDVCRATAAAPTYFEPALISSLSHAQTCYPLIDGGIFANNPALCAYAEVRKAKDAPTAADMFMLSLGTGTYREAIDYQALRDAPTMLMIPHLIDMIMSGVADTTDYQMRALFDAAHGKNSTRYVRIDADLRVIGQVDARFDNISAANIESLKAVAENTLTMHEATLRSVAKVLVEGGTELSY
ncbi:MAG: hypothetical protein RL660_1663 [Bacteroidota bacterium]|jgi:patatin-like phospholipase/acyl hydrolase